MELISFIDLASSWYKTELPAQASLKRACLFYGPTREAYSKHIYRHEQRRGRKKLIVDLVGSIRNRLPRYARIVRDKALSWSTWNCIYEGSETAGLVEFIASVAEAIRSQVPLSRIQNLCYQQGKWNLTGRNRGFPRRFLLQRDQLKNLPKCIW